MKSAIDIVNVVASTKLADAFDLPKIEAELEEAEYNKKKSFAAVSLQLVFIFF